MIRLGRSLSILSSAVLLATALLISPSGVAVGVTQMSGSRLPVAPGMASRDPVSSISAESTESISQNVLLYVFDPIIESRGGRRLHEVFGWGDPVSLTNSIVADLETASHGIVQYNIVQTQIVDAYPQLVDGFTYTDATWLAAWESNPRTPHNSALDWHYFLTANNIIAQINSGVFDEVWVYQDPLDVDQGGESVMAGDGAYWINHVPVSGNNGPTAFAIMDWNYERGVAEAIHSYGHRVENIMCHMYGIPPGDSCVDPSRGTNWSKFVTTELTSPGNGGVGDVHHPVNAASNYDYNNQRDVWSNADAWASYPQLPDSWRLMDAREWSPNGADPQREYLNWWYSHMPHAAGRNPDGLLNNWWHYIVEVDRYKYGDNPAPPNDNLASAASVSGTSGSVGGTNTYATIEASEPPTCSVDCPSTNHGPNATVWYLWTASGDGTATFDTCTNTFDTLLSAYTGSSYPLAKVTDSDDNCSGNTGSKISFDVTSGTTYRLQVDGYSSSDTGSFTLHWQFTPPSGGTSKPDARIRKGSGAFVGNNIYNTTATNQSKTGTAARGTTITFGISIQNDASTADRFSVSASGTASPGYTVRYFAGSTDITAAIVAGTYTTPVLAPGVKYLIKAKVTINSTATRGSSVSRLVTITSLGNGSAQDAVMFIATRR